ncbi:MAG: type IV pilus secretin PilQ [Desulfobacterales bacterium]|nr:type IV pilus secretin PilQ [Desulfobacterales bacterium]
MNGNVIAAWKKRWPLFVLGVVFVLIGCASKPPAKPAAVAPESTSKEKTIHRIAVSEDKATVLVSICANRPLSYTAVKHQFPVGVVLYFPDTALRGVKDSYVPETTLIKAIQASELKAKRRSSRIEIRLNEDVPYEVSRVENKVLVCLKNPVPAPEEVKETGEGLEVAQQMELKPQPEAKPEPAAVPFATEEVKKPAWVNRIDFEMMKDGKSRVIVGTTGKVRYETERVSEKRILLKLFDTRISKFQKRPLITTRFESAVDRILPVQTPKMGDMAVIVIELREAVPYRIQQKEKLCLLDLEASAVPPRPMAEAERPEWVRRMKEADAAVVQEAKRPPAEPVKVEAKKVKAYTGEKISLDFQDADIHNIFRILHEVSGKNFVIGADVKGRVTLRLASVPWDQVLDLILKMNKLDTIVDGNVVRIATLSTLETEQKAIKAKLKAEQDAKEQEPLVTEYIPVNYADASEVTKHLEGIKSDRGKVSFDERTNKIIIKDTTESIKNAKEVIERLDVVTPQVMIEARIVEVDSNFTRDLGVQWGGDVYAPDGNTIFGPVFQEWDIAGSNALTPPGDNRQRIPKPWAQNLAVNLPPSTPSSGIGFHFGRIAGSPVNLDVRLLAMESRGRGKTVSAPKVVTLDNKEAFITQGTEIPYQTLEEGTVTLKFVEAVLKLTVTPHITLDDRINMKINAKKDAPDWGNAVGGTPAIDKKETETELLVNDGETIVIGGILTSTDELTQKSVPFFSKIPLLGWLFKSKYTYKKKEELLIFITPKIIRLERSPKAIS